MWMETNQGAVSITTAEALPKSAGHISQTNTARPSCHSHISKHPDPSPSIMVHPIEHPFPNPNTHPSAMTFFKFLVLLTHPKSS